jgi:hypothetical protein
MCILTPKSDNVLGVTFCEIATGKTDRKEITLKNIEKVINNYERINLYKNTSYQSYIDIMKMLEETDKLYSM